MEVNIKNKKYDYAEKSIIKLNDVSPSFINILKEEYFNIDNTYNNKKILKKYMLSLNDIKDIIRDKAGKPSSNFIKDNMTFKFDTDDYIPLGKVLKFDVIILLKNVIENDFDYYPQVYLEECKYKND